MRTRTAVAVTTLLLAVATLVPATTAGAAAPVLPGTACQVFPSDNVWNTPISRLPVHAKSKVWTGSMHSSTKLLHPDFGPSGGQPYGIPWQTVSPSATKVPVAFDYDDESDPGPYPLSSATKIEGGSDAHALMVDPSTCMLYELFATHYRSGGQSTAGSGAIFDLSSNALRPAGWTSADAAGLPILPGLVDYDEVASGHMNHAIRVTADCTQRQYVWPARHQAGVANGNCPPMGTRFRLRASFTLPPAKCGAMCQTVLTTMKRYGLILADNGSDWYFTGTSDTRWTNDQMDQLKQIPAKQFLVVNENCLRVNQSSGQAWQPGSPQFEARCAG